MSQQEYMQRAKSVRETVNEVIPLAKATGFELLNYDGHSLSIRAPLEKNINDKGTGFAGSIATLGVLTGWYASTLAAMERFAKVDVAAVKTDLHYKAPIEGDIIAKADDIALAAREVLWANLVQKGRSRFEVQVILGNESNECAVFNGQYYVRVL